jgi:hypothetical protein
MALSVPAAKSKLPHVAIHGAFLGVREAGTLTDTKASMLKRAQRHAILQQGLLVR